MEKNEGIDMAKRPKGKITELGANYAKERGLSSGRVRGLTDYDIDDLEIIEDNTDIFLRELPIAIARALEEIGLVAERYAKRMCPVDTGRLRNSITHSVEEFGTSAIIGTNVEYGPYVELGTSWQEAANAGEGFLIPAVSYNEEKYRDIVKKHLKNAG